MNKQINKMLARIDDSIYRYPIGTWVQRWIPGVCKHEHVRCVHADEIILRNNRRVACLICGRSLDRPLPDICFFTDRPHK